MLWGTEGCVCVLERGGVGEQGENSVGSTLGVSGRVGGAERVQMVAAIETWDSRLSGQGSTGTWMYLGALRCVPSTGGYLYVRSHRFCSWLVLCTRGIQVQITSAGLQSTSYRLQIAELQITESQITD